MGKMVTLTIDDQVVSVPQGTLIVDAAKKAGIDIPVFCYHPKMEPVGMCRMCLVEVGRPVIDRATGQPVLEADGSPKIQFGPKLETACTTPVSEGMVVRTQTQVVAEARQGIIEFLLTSHPLDCPICDKGGECPLQNLTMAYGPGESRFRYEDKMHLAKHLPLGELIYLDRERCILCGRCVRFQSTVADDPVIAFSQRGRALQIVTFSEPGFDSYFSGNTTDICPVGALTTADFRFGARPWEMTPSASICPHCPVGCNITFNVRREAAAGGREVIKRVMPRQNEWVNEIWICDKGRFGYHYTESPERLRQPLVRKDGTLQPASWDEALRAAAEGLRTHQRLVSLAGGRLSNEDLFNLYRLTEARQGRAVLYSSMGGGDYVQRYGLSGEANLAALGKGDAILVVATDLHEEAPLWWLRVKQAAERGATLIVANARPTKLERYAAHVMRYTYQDALLKVQTLLTGNAPEAQALASAANLVIFYGSEGLSLEASEALAAMLARLLVQNGQVERPLSGLVAVWPHANTQGAWEIGFRPDPRLAETLSAADVVWVAAADPAGDDVALARALEKAGFVIVQDLFLTETARHADVVFPVQAFTEREGTWTTGERRVQRFYPALPELEGTRADFAIVAQVAEHLGLALEGRSALRVFQAIAQALPAFAGLSYTRLAEVVEQWPIVGRSDLYYGGTAYENTQGLGVRLARVSAEAEAIAFPDVAPAEVHTPEALYLVPFVRLYDQGQTLRPSRLLHRRVAQAVLYLAPQTAAQLGVQNGEYVQISADGWSETLSVQVVANVPAGAGLVPRSSGVALRQPQWVRAQRAVLEPQAGS